MTKTLCYAEIVSVERTSEVPNQEYLRNKEVLVIAVLGSVYVALLQLYGRVSLCTYLYIISYLNSTHA